MRTTTEATSVGTQFPESSGELLRCFYRVSKWPRALVIDDLSRPLEEKIAEAKERVACLRLKIEAEKLRVLEPETLDRDERERYETCLKKYEEKLSRATRAFWELNCSNPEARQQRSIADVAAWIAGLRAKLQAKREYLKSSETQLRDRARGGADRLKTVPRGQDRPEKESQDSRPSRRRRRERRAQERAQNPPEKRSEVSGSS